MLPSKTFCLEASPMSRARTSASAHTVRVHGDCMVRYRRMLALMTSVRIRGVPAPEQERERDDAGKTTARVQPARTHRRVSACPIADHIARGSRDPARLVFREQWRRW